MKLRPPSVPLITVDPYFSVWSPADRLYDEVTEHWTGSPNTMNGYVTIDGESHRFMGVGDTQIIPQTDFQMNAFVSHYTFANDKIVSLDEYWADDTEAPKWRLDKHIGTIIK